MKKDMKYFCTACNKTYSLDLLIHRCGECGEPLEVTEIQHGKINDEKSPLEQNILERYSEFFPFDEVDNTLSLGEGFTPLIAMDNLSKQIGVDKLYVKNESENPTWSFKDRGTYAGIQHALDLGIKKIGTVSTGNMAPSVAAYGAKANLKTYVFVSENIPKEKLNPIAIYDPELIKVEGDYGQLYYESLRIGKEENIYFINSDVPFRVEGSKTIAFEICEQLDFDMPDYIVVPTSAGGNIRGIEKGFREFRNAGYIKNIPKIICAQASGCCPISKAYNECMENISRFNNPDTIAHAIENPLPPSGNQVLRMIKDNGGCVIDVTDEEIIYGQRVLAKEGLFIQPASAVPIAAVIKLKESGYLKEKDSVICVTTGSGLKYTAAFDKHELKANKCKLEKLGAYIKGDR